MKEATQLDLFGIGHQADTEPETVVPETQQQPTSTVPTQQREAPIVVASGVVVGRPNVIEDAGVELVANRRNRVRTALKWDDVVGFNDALKVREVVKAKVWPRPDYKELIQNGMQPLVAHIVKQVYDSVAAKPAIARGKLLDDGALQLYIEALNQVADGLFKWVNDRDAIKDWVNRTTATVGGTIGRRVSLLDLMPEKSLLEAVYPGGHKYFPRQVQIAGGNKLYGALQPGFDECKRAIDAIKLGWPEARESWEIKGFSVVPLSGAKVWSPTPGPNGRHVLMVNDRPAEVFKEQEGAEKALALVRPFVLFGKQGFVGSFATEEEAIEDARLRARPGRSQGISDKGMRVEAVERQGVARRMPGEDITAQRMVDEFGLKGVNFGNWMKTPAAREEAQLHLNHAFDAFHDLADILGLPPKALGLNGMLGLAIGAQGSGGHAAAHFVPGVNEINLTRVSGAGSLGHEFAHAMDHYFATQAGLATAESPWLTEHAQRGAMIVRTVRTEKGWEEVSKPRFGELRPEITESFKTIVGAMTQRQQTQEEAAVAGKAALERNANNIEGWLSYIRKDFSGQEAEFDAIAGRIKGGEYGGEAVAVSPTAYLSPVVLELRELFKAKHGRVYSLENLKGLQAWLRKATHEEQRQVAGATAIPKVLTSNYKAEAKALDETKGGKPYWSTNLELFARAFDAFLSDELEARVARNDYLSHTGRSGNTVPTGEERHTINAAFRGLLGEFKVREVEGGGPVLHSFGADTVAQPLPREALQAELARIRRQWPGMPPAHIVNNTADLPFPMQSHADGAYHNGEVWVIADNIADVKQLQKVLAHECVLHHSLLEMLGPYGFSKLQHGLEALAANDDPTVSALFKDIKARYGDLPADILTMEVVASAGEQCLDEMGNVRVEFGFMKGVFAGIAGWLRDHGIPFPFTNLELQGIMHNAGQWVRQSHDVERLVGHTFQPVQSQALSSFGGVRAETAPLETLRTAREMKVTGADDRDIWARTGWTFAFPDGKPRFEISDHQADVVVENRTFGQIWMEMSRQDSSINTIGQFLQKYPDSPLTAEVNTHNGVRASYSTMATDDPANAREIINYLEHQALFKAYPELSSIRAAQQAGLGGLANAGAAALYANANLIGYGAIKDPDQFRSTTLHELQHAIQDIEGFSRGGNPAQFQTLDLTERELQSINQSVHELYEKSPEFYRDCVLANQLHVAVEDKYAGIADADPKDPLVREWWGAIDRRNLHPEANDWFRLKALEHQIAREKVVISPLDQYMRLAGEVEARLTQVRIDMSPVERREGYPLDDMDIPVQRQSLSFADQGTDFVRSGWYEGKVLDIADGVATQRVARDGGVVRHSLSALTGPVEIGKVATITYRNGRGNVVSDLGAEVKAPQR